MSAASLDVIAARRAPAPTPATPEETVAALLDDRFGDAVPAAPPPSPPRDEPPVFDVNVSELRPALRVVAPSKNVVPFRQNGADKASDKIIAEKRGLSTGERNAFQEIARQLGAHFDGAENSAPETPERVADSSEPAAPQVSGTPHTPHAAEWNPDAALGAIPPTTEIPTTAAPPAAAAALTPVIAPEPDLRLLDRLPLALMIYRGDEVMFASRQLLEWTGHNDAAALARAGGIEAVLDQRPADDATPACARPAHAGRHAAGRCAARQRAVARRRRDDAHRHAHADPAPQKEAEAARERRAGAQSRTPFDPRHRDRRRHRARASDGRIQSANRSAQALFGYEADEFADLAFLDLFAPESHRDAADYLDGLHAQRRRQPAQRRPRGDRPRAPGRPHPAVHDHGPRRPTSRFCAVFRDITQWKRAEEELTNAKRQAEKASSAKSDFLANISHEIRTPLNAIIGFSEVMMEERFGPVGNERYREYLKDIHTSGEHMISLINDLLDLSKIEAGKLDLTFAKVDLNDVMQQCVAIMQPQANRERIIIRTALSPSLPPVVADQRSVRQIVLNLLSNSIKFTGAGGQVIVSTALTDQGEAVLRVRDTGVGMSEKDIATALEPFRQLPTTRRDSDTGGTGLGLPLTKALSEANRAEFRIKSAVNAGTLVEIVFPGNPRSLRVGR